MDKLLEIFIKVAHADPPAGPPTPSPSGSATFVNPLGGTTDFAVLLNKVLGVLIQIGIPLLVLVIVYAGFLFVTAGGAETKVEEAKKTLFWAVIGGAILIGAKVIAKVVCDTVGAVSCPIL
ncbi:MAG TPA: pilin [Candidatus Paceibacterota bacterium]